MVYLFYSLLLLLMEVLFDVVQLQGTLYWALNSAARSFCFSQIIYWLEMIRLAVRCATLPLIPAGGVLRWDHTHPTWAELQEERTCSWRSVHAVPLKLRLFHPSNSKNQELVALKCNWISASCTAPVLSWSAVIQALLSHLMLKDVFMVEQFCVSLLAQFTLVLLHLSRF